MVVMSGAASKKFGDIYYLFIIIFVWTLTIVFQVILVSVEDKNFVTYLIIICILNSLLNAISVHLLVGSRIITVIAFPEKFERGSIKISDYSELVPLRKDSGRYKEFFKKIVGSLSQSSNTTVKVSTNNTFSNSGSTANPSVVSSKSE
eukprot:jgi/Orpsp1_1/1181274/evm.model.c7180000076577.1